MGSDSASVIADAMALAWKEYGQPKYVYNGIMCIFLFMAAILWYWVEIFASLITFNG